MKRTLCLVLAVLVLMLSVCTFSAFAEDTTNTDCIYFQVPTATEVAWKNFSIVFCHIWAEGDEGGDFYPWQAKDERCTDLGNGYYSYDISGLTFKEDCKYSVIFSNENGMQTYNLTLTSACKGDIVYCEGDTCENPVDSAKQCAVARWMQNKETVHPSAVYSSDGVLLDPDGVFNTDIDLKWGTSEGVSIEMPKVEIPTEAETEEVTETTNDEKDNNGGLSGLSTLTLIIGGVVLVLLIAVGAVVIAVVLKKKR